MGSNKNRKLKIKDTGDCFGFCKKWIIEINNECICLICNKYVSIKA